MSGYILRPYQEAAAVAGVAYLRERRLGDRTVAREASGLIIAPTGSGKSLVIAALATRLDGPCLVFQPTKEILEQNLAKLAHYGYRAAVFSASMNRREIGTITLATIGSVVRHAEAFRALPYVLIDECHLVSARSGMYRDFLRIMPQARVLGLTATPYRLASNSFGSELRFLTRTIPRVFNHVAHFTQIGDLFRDGYLCPLEYRDVPVLPREKLRLNTKGSDYTDASVQRLFGEVGFVGRLVDEVERELAAGRKNVLVFTRFVDEARRLAAAVHGAAVVTAETPPRERAAILDDFKAGRIRVVTNVGIIALGFDYPELECVILARPSISLALYYQQVGRAIRPVYAPGMDVTTAMGRGAAMAASPKPRAYVVDMVGLVRQFGRIEDIQLTQTGARRDLWIVETGGRQLTNILFAQRDESLVDAAFLTKAEKTRRFWATGGHMRRRWP